MCDIGKWIFSTYPEEYYLDDINDKFLRSLRVTARCRFNAAKRLQLQSRFAFFTTSIFSLGLILIPLLQIAEISQNFSPKVLGSMQIFLAVAVLVYSTTISTSKLESRILMLYNCANQIKVLIRNIEEDIKESKLKSLSDYKSKYANILDKVENHEDSDFSESQLEMPKDYKFTGIKWIFKKIQLDFWKFYPLFVPFLLLSFEVVFIFDMVGATEILTPLHYNK